MSIKLGIKNFQSFSSALFDFNPGFTLIVGPNSSGKSAIFRGIKALTLNTPSAARNIKHGESESLVAFKEDNNPTIVWKREKKSSSYKVGDKLFEKAGRARIHTIVSEFPLLVEDSGRIVNIHSEWDKLFPFDKSPTEMFALFEDIFQIASSARVLDGMKEDEKGFKEEIEEFSAERATNLRKIVKIEEFSCDSVLKELIERKRKWVLVSEVEKMGVSVERALSLKKSVEFMMGLSVKQFSVECFSERSRIYRELLSARLLSKQLKVPLELREISMEPVSLVGKVKLELQKAKVLERELSVVIEKREYDLRSVETFKRVTIALGLVHSLVLEARILNEEEAKLEKEIQELNEKKSKYKNCPLCGTLLGDNRS